MGFMRIVVHRPGAYNPNVSGNMVRRVTKVTARPMSVGGASLKFRGVLALRDAMGRKLGGGRCPQRHGSMAVGEGQGALAENKAP
jgi:hypothetical protein